MSELNNSESVDKTALSMAHKIGLETVATMAEVRHVEPDGKPFALVKAGFSAVDLSGYAAPKRAAAVTFDEVDSFVDYVNAMRDARTRIFCDMMGQKIVAVLDFHLPAEHAAHKKEKHELARAAERCLHTATLCLKSTHEADEWRKYNGAALSQAAFAEFLEDRALEVVKPGAGDIMDIAKTLEMKPNLEFKSSQRESDGGYNLIYQETANATAGQNGNLEVPALITVRMPIFQGAEAVEVDARLRYRLVQGQLSFSYRFIRYEEAVREQLQKIRKQVAEATSLLVHSGSYSR